MIKTSKNIELVTYRLVIKPGSVASTRPGYFFLFRYISYAQKVMEA